MSQGFLWERIGIVCTFSDPVAEGRPEPVYGDSVSRHTPQKRQHRPIRQRTPFLAAREQIAVFCLGQCAAHDLDSAVTKRYSKWPAALGAISRNWPRAGGEVKLLRPRKTHFIRAGRREDEQMQHTLRAPGTSLRLADKRWQALPRQCRVTVHL